MVMPQKQTRAALAPAAQKAAALLRKEKKEPVVTDKQRAAIHAMVFEGQKRPDAAKTAGMTDEALRVALTKTNVLAYLNEQIEVLRTSFRPRALRKMGDLLEAKTERIQFEAAKYLDGMDRPSHAVGATQTNVQINTTVNVTPGFVIDLRPDELANAGVQIEHLEADEVIPLAPLSDVPDDG